MAHTGYILPLPTLPTLPERLALVPCLPASCPVRWYPETHVAGVAAEQFLEQVGTDVGLTQAVQVLGQAARLQLVAPDGHRGAEVAQQACKGSSGSVGS